MGHGSYVSPGGEVTGSGRAAGTSCEGPVISCVGFALHPTRGVHTGCECQLPCRVLEHTVYMGPSCGFAGQKNSTRHGATAVHLGRKATLWAAPLPPVVCRRAPVRTAPPTTCAQQGSRLVRFPNAIPILPPPPWGGVTPPSSPHRTDARTKHKSFEAYKAYHEPNSAFGLLGSGGRMLPRPCSRLPDPQEDVGYWQKGTLSALLYCATCGPWSGPSGDPAAKRCARRMDMRERGGGRAGSGSRVVSLPL